MKAHAGSSPRQNGENQRDHPENEADSVRIVRFPKEVAIFGNISRVCFEGNENHERLIFDRESPPEDGRKKCKNYVIIPVKDGNSKVQFVKAPLYKLSGKPKAKKVGDARCRKLNPFGEETTKEDLPEWSADRREIYEWKEFVSRRSTDTGTKFTFHHTDGREGRRKSEIGGRQGVVPPLAIRPKEESKERMLKETEFVEEDSSPGRGGGRELQNPPPLKRPKPSEDVERDFPRILQYLVTVKGKNRKGKNTKVMKF